MLDWLSELSRLWKWFFVSNTRHPRDGEEFEQDLKEAELTKFEMEAWPAECFLASLSTS